MQSKTIVKALTVAGLALATAGPAYAEPARCQTVKFSEAVVIRFPRIREVCQDVVTKDGQDYAVVKGNLLRITSTTARIQPKMPDGTKGMARDLSYDPNRMVMVEGKAMKPKDIAIGQELTFYVKVTEPVAALEPADTAPLAPMPLPAEPAAAPAPATPKPASPPP